MALCSTQSHHPWITYSELVLSYPRCSCAVIAVGSGLVVAGRRRNSTVETFWIRTGPACGISHPLEIALNAPRQNQNLNEARPIRTVLKKGRIILNCTKE